MRGAFRPMPAALMLALGLLNEIAIGMTPDIASDAPVAAPVSNSLASGDA